MNKHIFYVAAACVALASCVKNEVRVNAPDQEITFQTVSTKAGVPFNTDNYFFSYAYFLEDGKTWNANHDKAQAYIYNAKISYITPPSGTTSYWAAAKPYYWPKQGSLTFFAWTDDTSDPSVGTDATVSCAHDTGIKIENYSVKDNLNKDILVAEIAKDEKSNTSATGAWEQGVPTVFRHALAKVEFKVNKKKAYDNVTFKVKSITLNGVSTRGTFTQYQSNPDPENWGWSNQDTPEDLSVFTGDVEVTKTADSESAEFDPLNPVTGDYSIVLPQNFDNDTPTLTIVYDIITSYTGTPVTETVTETKALNTIYTSNWECKKNYILGITLGLNKIYWDPSVVAWDDTGAVTDIQF